MELNDFGMNWNEESVNLNLFEDLEELEYIPENETLALPKSLAMAPQVHYSIQLPASVHDLNGNASESSADISALTAEFQAILDSLPKDNTEALSEVLEIAGIPTTIIDGEALVPIELDLNTFITASDEQSINTEENMDLDEINDNDSDIIDESELYDISNQGSPTPSVYSNSHYNPMISTTVVDEHSEAAHQILDALLVGDVDKAETYLPSIADTDPDYTEDDEESLSSESEYSFDLGPSSSQRRASASSPAAVNKPERRGRKPGKKLAKGSPAYIRDKTLRKKEQNKTAATRYRQKKKMEFSIILGAEEELQKENDELEKKKDNLQREILMVKQLLRDVLQAKKPVLAKKQVAPIIHGGSSTTSVGRNRRK